MSASRTAAQEASPGPSAGVPQIGCPLMLREVLISHRNSGQLREFGQHGGQERVLVRGQGLHSGGVVGVHDGGDFVRGSGR